MLNETDLSRTDLNLLVLFEVVLEQRHVGRAAQQLNLSASAVSHGLGRLRRMLQDPLFLKTPKGVVPTARATELAGPIADILARVRNVVASAGPFDPATSTRRFTIGAVDPLSAVLVPPLLSTLRRKAPAIDLALRELLPPERARSPEHGWEPALAALDTRAIDIALLPLAEAPARFDSRVLYDEDFVIAVRAGHSFAARPTINGFCAMRHLVVSLTGDAFGFVDRALAQQGRARRIALTVPNFMMALSVLAETDLLAALPRRLALRHARRFGVIGIEPPLALPHFRISAIAPRVALMDAGVAWLFDALRDVAAEGARTGPRRRRVPN